MGRVYRRDCDQCGDAYVGGGKLFCSITCAVASLGDLRTRWERAVPDRPPGGCWIWRGAVGGEGYGAIRDGGVQQKAHRVAYALLVGPIPEGLSVLHHCDVPRCVNPAHLYVGTAKDNNRDTRERRRFVSSPGERNGSAKLTEKAVSEIRRLYAAGGISQDALAARYGVSQRTVSDVVLGKLWRRPVIAGV